VAEKLAFEHALDEGFAVDRDKGTPDPVAPVVNQPCDQFLARPAFALDQHRGVAARDTPHQFHQFAALDAFGDHRIGAEAPSQLLAQRVVLVLELVELERPLHPRL
jgi:hypothetical protein